LCVPKPVQSELRSQFVPRLRVPQDYQIVEIRGAAQRKRPGGSAGAGMRADLLFPGAFAETLAGAGFGRPMPVLSPR